MRGYSMMKIFSICTSPTQAQALFASFSCMMSDAEDDEVLIDYSQLLGRKR